MSDKKKLDRILKFKRGETFSVDVLIKVNGDFVFNNIVTPPATPQNVLEQFIYDAEIAAIDHLINEEIEKNAAH